MIEGIAFNFLSHVATKLVRGPLIAYTQPQADLHSIQLEAQDSGPLLPI